MRLIGSKKYRGLHGLSRAWLVSQLQREEPRLVVVTRDRGTSDNLFSDLTFFVSDAPVLRLTNWETLPFEAVSPATDVTANRLSVLAQISKPDPFILVTSADVLAQRTVPRSFLQGASFTLAQGMEVEREALLQQFDRAGFRRSALVEKVGDLAVRGGVIDFFPSTTNAPVRLEFLDVMIEQIRSFDIESQRSNHSLHSVEVIPVREHIDLRSPEFAARFEDGVERIKTRGRQLETPPRDIARAIHALRSGAEMPGIELLQTIALGAGPTIFEFLGSDTHFVVDDTLAVSSAMDDFDSVLDERAQRLAAEHQLFPDKKDLFLSPAELQEALSSRRPTLIDHLEVLGSGEEEATLIHTESNIELATRLKTKVGSGHALQPLKDAIKKWRRDHFNIAFVVGSQARAERLHRLLLDIEIDAPIAPHLSGAHWIAAPRRLPAVILHGQITEGVQLVDEKLVFIAEGEIFNERSYRKGRGTGQNLKRLLNSLAQLQDGDHVVHADYGIGIYRGLVHLEVEGAQSDFLHIDYADSRLYLPIQQIGKVQKFSAAEGQAPVLDKLGSNRWLKTKQKVRESVVSLAGDLIKLYATRHVAKGWRYEPYNAEDDRFSDGFPFDETPDQWKAIQDTISDMASDKPMDRLVCGDVGFGKTEVALRAAFKCVEHARQVAMLVPTTVLVEQHKKGFIERFMGYPVKIGAVSRFYNAETNRTTLEQLATGELDIVVGTHKLLGRDVHFKDLGLVIVDEEHRFGVKQKERLKQLKKQVDVLTLTATPIPRTLHMSLLGIRDISVISTPPQDRRAIRTYVAQENDGIIRDAVLRELQRGGQCFYLHNRVQDIEMVVAKLRALVPEARFEFAHGQMNEHQLEPIMRRFVDREFDVLVSTTIIESGLDIPNANTILVDRADMLGLAQLYQLRGRVGRGTRQAYAYLLIPSVRTLTPDAQKRLKVLQSLDELGVGFNLALRDLEIRGAGNLLGKEQSGNVLAVGFDLYTKILKEAVLNLKGEDVSVEEAIDPEVKLGVNAYIPDYYIPDISERLVLYQRLAALESPELADELRSEIEDRFGHFGEEVANLIEVMRLRALFRIFGVQKAEISRGKLVLSFSPKAPVDPEKIIRLVQQDLLKYRFHKSFALSIGLTPEQMQSPLATYQEIEGLLRKVSTDAPAAAAQRSTGASPS